MSTRTVLVKYNSLALHLPDLFSMERATRCGGFPTKLFLNSSNEIAKDYVVCSVYARRRRWQNFDALYGQYRHSWPRRQEWL